MHESKIDRRTWITGSVAAVAGLSVKGLLADPVDADLDIIDCHTHFYDPSRPERVPWPPKDSPLYRTVLPKHLRAQKQFRPVTGTLIIEASPRLEDNAWLLDLAKDDPFVVGIVGNLEPGSPKFAEHVERFAANPLFRGIRILVTSLKELLVNNSMADLKRLADHDLSLDVNGGPETPGVVAQLAPRVPSLRIVQNHVGNVKITSAPPPRDWTEGIRAAASYPNVYCKISALVQGAARDGQKPPTDLDFYRPYIDVVWNAFGDERVIYGSDWPVSDAAADYATLQRIAMEYAFEKGEQTTRQFCSLNAKKAYKWVDRPGRRSA